MRRLVVYPLAALLGLHPSIGRAQWQPDGNPVCTAANTQGRPSIVSDGAGGAIVAWEDHRSSTVFFDIYAQRIKASGVVQWTPDGVALCLQPRSQQFPTCASDGAGGAIVTWEDQRVLLANPDIFAQRIDASGAVQWTADGVSLCVADHGQFRPVVVPDGVGGAVVAWTDSRSGLPSGGSYKFAQRVDAAGSVQWTNNGVLLNDNPTPSNGTQPAIVPDGAGGGIVAWMDTRSGDSDIYVQRIDSNGVVQWASEGLAVCTATGDQLRLAMIPDGSGGAIMTWDDQRVTVADARVYAQRVDASGALQWTANGVRVCDLEFNQLSPHLVSDDAGGAIVTWYDNRSSQFGTYQILAQHIDGSGVPQWTPEGVQISNPLGFDQTNPVIVSDGASGAIVIWVGVGLVAQRVDASGAVRWAAGGVTVTHTGSGGQVAIPNGNGGVIVAWADTRSGSDIYAMELDASGGTPTGISDLLPISTMTLSPNWPNPFSVRTTLSLDLPTAADVAVDVADVSGRVVRRMDLGRRNAGTIQMSFDGRNNLGRLLPNGVYFYSVHARGATLTHKLEIMR